MNSLYICVCVFYLFSNKDWVQKNKMVLTPPPLKHGDTIRVISPSRSGSIISANTRMIATKRLSDLELIVTFSKHIDEKDEFNSSLVQHRVSDLHEAFADKSVKGILTMIGGHNCNQMLPHIDWDLVKANPKLFCGYSDITALQNSILAKTGLVTYAGPHFSTFGMEKGFDFTLNHFRRIAFGEDEVIDLVTPQVWSDDLWFLNQHDRVFLKNEGHVVINSGYASGQIIGGNLCTFGLLRGTPFMPTSEGAIVFLEEDNAMQGLSASEFDRNLQALLCVPSFKPAGLVIGRFQKNTVTTKQTIQIIRTKSELNGIPIICNADFGHTDPLITYPIGGYATLDATDSANVKLSISISDKFK